MPNACRSPIWFINSCMVALTMPAALAMVAGTDPLVCAAAWEDPRTKLATSIPPTIARRVNLVTSRMSPPTPHETLKYKTGFFSFWF